MEKLFVQRNTPEPNDLRDDVSPEAKRRFVKTASFVLGRRFRNLLDDLEKRLEARYGSLFSPAYHAASTSNDPVIDHFHECDAGTSLEFIEAVFQTDTYTRFALKERRPNDLVDMTNDIFRECGIGFALTQMRIHEPPARVSDICRGTPPIRFEYPQAIVKSSQYEYKEIIEPALQALGDPRFRVANTELLKAHQAYREGKFDDVFTNGGASLESVLKTICDAKGWVYDRDKDSLSALVRICKDEGLFPAFYAPMLESSGTVRNKLGAAHGRGPMPAHSPGDPHVNHFLQLISAHMLMLIRLTNL